MLLTTNDDFNNWYIVSVHVNILTSKKNYSRKYTTVKHKNTGGKAKCFTKKEKENTLVTLKDFARFEVQSSKPFLAHACYSWQYCQQLGSINSYCTGKCNSQWTLIGQQTYQGTWDHILCYTASAITCLSSCITVLIKCMTDFTATQVDIILFFIIPSILYSTSLSYFKIP